MQKLNYLTTIAIDTERSAFHFYSMAGDDKTTVAHYIKNYSGAQFDDEFFKQLKEAIKDFAQSNPAEGVRKVTVVLPDNAILTDIVKIPSMRGAAQMKKTLDTTLDGLYRNYKDLKITSQVVQQNKQHTTFAITAVQKRIVSAVFAACSENKFLADNLTYYSSAAVSGAVTLNPKLKGATYLFLDIKDGYSRFVFVAGGKVVGYYPLPFGLDFLKKHRVVQEDMLFDHSLAELTVQTSKERASQSGGLILEDDDIDELDGEEFSIDDESDIAQNQANRNKSGRKTPRRLPEFMLREIPKTKDGVFYENFRVFVKWALTLIAENESITELGKPAFVCVNLPRELVGVLDTVNAKAEENGISFIPLTVENEKPKILLNLELYGSLFPKQISVSGKF